MGEIKKIKPLSLAKILGIIGLMAGILIVMLLGIFSKYIPSEEIAFAGITEFLTTLVTFTIVYGILGFLIGLLFALFYNLITKYTKGIEIELK